MGRFYFVISLVSCSILIFEVSLTRLFSIYLWYHFAFMVISIAMLGIGSAGTALAILRASQTVENSGGVTKVGETIDHRVSAEQRAAMYAALAGLSILAGYVIANYIPFDPVRFSWEKTQIFYLALYCLVLGVPFFFSGLLLSTVFLSYSNRSMLIYGSDLIGAGTGSLIVLGLLNIAGPEYAVLSAAALSLTGAAITGRGKIRSLSLILLAINLSVFITHPDFIHVRISPYKKLPLYLTYPGSEHLRTYYSPYARIDTFKSPAVRFAPGLSLKYTDSLPEQIAFSIDGDATSVVTDVRDNDKLRFLEFLPPSLVYRIHENSDVLVIDPKGGLQVLMAGYFGSERIHKVESNALIVKIVRDDFNDFSGGIYDRNTWTGYGRNSLEDLSSGIGGTAAYDVIDISLTDTSVSGVFGVAEDYQHTVEAFKIYLNALKKDGIVSISMYLIPPPRTELRLLATIIAAFEQLGVQDARDRLAAIRSWDSMTVLVKNTPLTQDEIRQIKSFSEDKRFDLVYYPGIREYDSNKFIKMPADYYFEGFNKILSRDTRQTFLDDYLFDIRPVHDDRPFFQYYLKFSNFRAIYETMGQKFFYFLEEGYLLPVILIIILVLSIILIMSPVLFYAMRAKRINAHCMPSFAPAFIYFSMLGGGFMFVEVSLIQKSILLLENPSFSFAVILTSILIGSGIGSMSASKSTALQTPYSILILASLICIFSLIYPHIINVLLPLGMTARIVIIAAALMPLGFFMGIPFPMGMKVLGSKHQALIPWAWAVNACMSVIAPILTVMIALITGFTVVLWTGILAYLAAFISLRRLMSL